MYSISRLTQHLSIVDGIPTEVVPEIENEAEDVPKKSKSIG